MSATETKAPPAAPPKQWKMPRPYLGEAVLFRAEPGGEGFPAMVVEVSDVSVSLLIFPHSMHNGISKGGVRHAEDPRVAKMSREAVKDFGLWELSEFGRWARSAGFAAAAPKED